MKQDRISTRQLGALLWAGLMAPAAELLPAVTLPLAGRAAWLSALAALPVVLLIGWTLTKLDLSRDGLAGAVCRGMGPWAGKGVLLLYMIWGELLLALRLRLCAQRLLTAGERDGSLWFFLPAAAALVLWMARGKLSAFARAGQLFFLVLAVTGGAILLLSLPQVRAVRLICPERRSYAAYREETAGHPQTADESISVEAELPAAKSHSSILPTYDRSSPAIQPNAPDRILLNLIGGSSYARAGQWLEWSIEVKKAGYYNLSFRYTQDSLRGLGVGRRILLDGAVPFEEFELVRFPYAESFATFTPAGKDGAPFRLYLEAGAHTLRLEVNGSHLEQSALRLKELVKQGNDLYRSIVSVTGVSPDPYRDYYLDKELPDLLPGLRSLRQGLEETAEAIDRYSDGTGGSETAVLQETVRLLDSFEQYQADVRRYAQEHFDALRTQLEHPE